MRARLVLRYLWAAPASAVGLVLAAVACAFGATVRLRQDVLEVAGGGLAALLRRAFPRLRFRAITFGHLVSASATATSRRLRRHERVHVRQYERWGILFFPLYLGSSAVQLLSRTPSLPAERLRAAGVRRGAVGGRLSRCAGVLLPLRDPGPGARCIAA